MGDLRSSFEGLRAGQGCGEGPEGVEGVATRIKRGDVIRKTWGNIHSSIPPLEHEEGEGGCLKVAVRMGDYGCCCVCLYCCCRRLNGVSRLECAVT